MLLEEEGGGVGRECNDGGGGVNDDEREEKEAVGDFFIDVVVERWIGGADEKRIGGLRMC